jgi:cAMP phosphodiesterase
MSGVRKRIWATSETLKDLEQGVFSDRVWPNLASWNAEDPPFKLLYSASVPFSHGARAHA